MAIPPLWNPEVAHAQVKCEEGTFLPDRVAHSTSLDPMTVKSAIVTLTTPSLRLKHQWPQDAELLDRWSGVTESRNKSSQTAVGLATRCWYL
jgi:hypothetical protein